MSMHRLSSSPQRLRAALMLSICLLLAQENEGHAQRLQAGDRQTCQLTPGGEAAVVAVAGPQMLRLADGRFVRLAEVMAPTSPSGSGFDSSAAVMAFLRSAALGRKVEVKFGGASRDRYGVYAAHAFVAGDTPFWLQGELVSAGLALASPQADNRSCSRQLMALEADAREKKRGNWGIALFKVLAAGDVRSISNLAGTYQIVEGAIHRVTQAGGRTFLHFGEEGKPSFVAVIEPAAQKQLREQTLDSWRGKTFRVRGWIERKKGPSLSIVIPEQIEPVGDQSVVAAPG
jgi:micrococcal nuclease